MMHTREQEIEMINSPEKWPMWPFLPLKKYGETGFPACAVTWEQERQDGKIQMRVGVTMFEGNEAFNSAELVEFESTEALVDAGWIVD